MKCGVQLARLRAAPRDDAEQVTQALRGEPLSVEVRVEGWARVVTAYGYGGWVREAALAAGDGRFPEPIGGDPAEVARSLIGAPYEWGGLSERGIDCSGLVHLAFRLCGRLVPRDAWQQEAAGQPVDVPVRGDLVTYGEGVRADHVAFWFGEGRIVHATARDGLGVVEENEPPELAFRRRKLVRM